MSIIYKATLTPSKLDVLGTIFDLSPEQIAIVAKYRFDDPDGEVGMEVFLVSLLGDELEQVALSYRAAPLPDAEEHLVSQMQHSVLGTRYVYEAVGDPLFAETLERVISTGGGAAKQFLEPSGVELTEGLATVWGTGALPVRSEDEDLVVGLVDTVYPHTDEETNLPGLLLGTWEGQTTPVVLAELFYASELDDEDALE